MIGRSGTQPSSLTTESGFCRFGKPTRLRYDWVTWGSAYPIMPRYPDYSKVGSIPSDFELTHRPLSLSLRLALSGMR